MRVPRVSIKHLNKSRSQLEWRNPDGCRRRLRVDSSVAEEYAFKIRQFLIQGKNPEVEMEKESNRERARNLKLKEFWHPFAKEHLPTLRPKTQELYRYLMNTISNYPIARLPLVEINRRAVIQYQQQRKGKVKPATINGEVRLIKTMLGCALGWEILDRDQRPGIKLLKEHNRRDVSNVTPEQIVALFECLPDTMADISKTALYTGFRKETILGRKIDQVQLPDIGDIGIVNIEAKGGGCLPKKIGPQAVKIFKKAIGARTEGYVFLSPRGDRYKSIHKTFDRRVRDLGIVIADGRKFCFHDLRRWYATRMLKSGRSLEEVRDALDHKDTATTGLYAKFMGGDDVFEPVLERKEE